MIHRHLISFLSSCVFVLLGCSCDKPKNFPAETTEKPACWVIDADVPGTELFMDGRKLGTVPFTLTAEFIESLGLPPQGEHLNWDGWGGGIRLGIQDEHEVELLFRVPDEVAASYRTIETPWGRRTGTSGSQDNKITTQYRMAPIDRDGMILTISVPEQHQDPKQPIEIQVRAEYAGPDRLLGADPNVFILWGTYQVGWRRRNISEVALPASWSEFAPGDVKETNLQFEAPNVNDDFHVFVVFHLNEPLDPEQLMFTVYSNAEMFSTRYPNCPPRCRDD